MPEGYGSLWVVLGSGILALLCLGQAIRFTRGSRRQLAAGYWNPGNPWYIRNAVFTLYPLGAMFSLWALATVLILTANAWAALVGLGLVMLSGIAFLFAGFWGWHPPQFLKPTWLREKEAFVGPPGPPTRAVQYLERAVLGMAIALAVIVVAGPPLLVMFGR